MNYNVVDVRLDMDGVVCNFKKAYGNEEFDREIFRKKVIEDKIFNDLEWMPNGQKLVEVLLALNHFGVINLSILSSLGCGEHDIELGKAACAQKNYWLDKNNINIDRNFVLFGEQKKLFATKDTLLIDDTKKVIDAFSERGGKIVHYVDEYYKECLEQIFSIIMDMRNSKIEKA